MPTRKITQKKNQLPLFANKRSTARDLIGQRFGLLKVIQRAAPSHKYNMASRSAKWLCQCDCGKEKIINSATLRVVKSCGCNQYAAIRKDLTGVRSGRLVALRYASTGKPGDTAARWLCKCDCGAEVIVRSWMLSGGKQRSCGCLSREYRERRTLPSGHAAMRDCIRNYKKSAKTRGYTWNLSEADCQQLFTGACHYCGAAPSRETKIVTGNGEFTYNGIDRIDNAVGYEPRNCVSCCTRCNLAKGTMAHGEFIEMARRIAERFPVAAGIKEQREHVRAIQEFMRAPLLGAVK